MCHASHQWSRTEGRGNCRGKKSSMLLFVFSFWWFWHATKPTDLKMSRWAHSFGALKNPCFQKKNATLLILRSLHCFFISLIMHYLPYISIFHMLIRLLHIPIFLFPLHLSAAIAASKIQLQFPQYCTSSKTCIASVRRVLNSSFAGHHILYSPTAGVPSSPKTWLL